jgi:hypothetical protein
LAGILRFAEGVSLGPIAGALNVDDLGVIDQAVEDGKGDDRVAEQLLPVDEALFRCQDGGALLVAARDKPEEQIGLAMVIRGAASFGDDKAGAETGFALVLWFLEL